MRIGILLFDGGVHTSSGVRGGKRDGRRAAAMCFAMAVQVRCCCGLVKPRVRHVSKSLQRMKDLAQPFRKSLPDALECRSCPEPPRARLADIARQAEVSEATVSRVLNDKPGVSPDTRQAVLTALDVLGYERPDRLRKRSAGLVGLVTPELENPIFPLFAQIIESSLAQQGYTPVLCTQTAGRGDRGRVRRDAARPGGRRDHLRLRAARRHHHRPRPLPQADRPAAADRAGQRIRPRACDAPSSPATTGSPASSRSTTWPRSGTSGSG